MLSAMQAGANTAAGVVAKVEDPAQNSKRITDWIKSIGNLQKVKIAALLGTHVLVTPTQWPCSPKGTHSCIQIVLGLCQVLRM